MLRKSKQLYIYNTTVIVSLCHIKSKGRVFQSPINLSTRLRCITPELQNVTDIKDGYIDVEELAGLRTKFGRIHSLPN